ncbi:hypothetical protein [Agromyces laixinhei]|uniref:hypothetical protein n=1 Tax=Agromyces laixinhei TaxID=2585717 RepID=UPI0012EEA9A6|nr:hypothetical protein [Agromyces laixinhei]
MIISELSFPHLQAAHEARLTHDLERRRVVTERLANERANRLAERNTPAVAPRDRRIGASASPAHGTGSAPCTPLNA